MEEHNKNGAKPNFGSAQNSESRGDLDETNPKKSFFGRWRQKSNDLNADNKSASVNRIRK